MQLNLNDHLLPELVEPGLEVLDHVREPLPQSHLGLPVEVSLGLGDVGLSPAGVIRGVLHEDYVCVGV